MKDSPVVEVIQIHCILNGAVIIATRCAEDFSTGIVVVNVADDVGVELVNGLLIERTTLLVKDPRFEFDVGRVALNDKCFEGALVDAKSIKNHLVVSSTASGVVRVQLSGGAERGFEPKAGEVKNAERTDGAGTDKGDDITDFILEVLVVFGGFFDVKSARDAAENL